MLHINHIYDFFFSCCYTHVPNSKGGTSAVAHAHSDICSGRHCAQTCPHPLQTIRQHTARHARTHTHTLPSRLQSQHSKRSCQNSGTSNTAIDRWLWRSRKRLRRHVVDVELTPLDGSYAPDETFASWIYIPCMAFPPLLSTSFCHSCNLPFSLSKSPFSFPQSASSSL